MNAFQIAVQGAGFPLSTLSMAVHGLLYPEEPQDLLAQYIGGGYRSSVSAQSKANADAEAENDLILRVLDKWEYIDAQNELARIQSLQSAPLPEQTQLNAPATEIGDKDVKISPNASAPITVPGQSLATESSQDSIRNQRHADEEALMLILANL